ncbi:MAG: hydrogenase [Elusimicrobiota bacterium]
MIENLPCVSNCEVISLDSIPNLTIKDFRECVLKNIKNGCRIVSYFGVSLAGSVRLYIVLADQKIGKFIIMTADVEDEYECLTLECAQAHLFEREIYEQCGVNPKNHPALKPVRVFSKNLVNKDLKINKVKGEDIHEVAVGPVHAGIIEPGHFRFQCYGENVYYLDISLGYQYRGIERALAGGPDKKTMHYIETAAGDSTSAHGLAYSGAYEALSDCNVSERAHVLRSIVLELERLANHTGDLGALANDIAYLPTASFCGRLRGDFLNLTALICGNRFGRGMICAGGVLFDIDDALITELLKRIEIIYRDLESAVNLLWNTPSVMDFFEGTGVLTKKHCEELGIVGLPARACGVSRDVRSDFPFGNYRLDQIPVSIHSSGDVLARAYVRWLEIQRSIVFIKNNLKTLPKGKIQTELNKTIPNSLVVSVVEGFRGEICHTVITDKKGKFSKYKIVDASFHNWIGLEMVLRNEQISNFPLCNKSFSLSYCGHDL